MSNLFKIVDRDVAYFRLYDLSLLPKDQQIPGDLPLQIHCIMNAMQWDQFIKHAKNTSGSRSEFDRGYNKIKRRLRTGVVLKRPVSRQKPYKNSVPTELPDTKQRTQEQWNQGRATFNSLLNEISKE